MNSGINVKKSSIKMFEFLNVVNNSVTPKKFYYHSCTCWVPRLIHARVGYLDDMLRCGRCYCVMFSPKQMYTTIPNGHPTEVLQVGLGV